MDSNQTTLPPPKYIDIFLPDGKHSGARVDMTRCVLEIQRKGLRYYFDLTQYIAEPIDSLEHSCYDIRQMGNG